MKAIVDDEEYVQYDFTMDDTIDDMHESPFEPDGEESNVVSEYVQAHLQMVNHGNKQWIPPPQVEMGNVKEIELTEDGIPFKTDQTEICNYANFEKACYCIFCMRTPICR